MCLISLHTQAKLKHKWKAYVLHNHYFRNCDRLNGKYEFSDYFQLIFISYIVLDIQKCSVMLKTALFDSLPKDVGVNSRKISVRWGRFRFFVNIRFCDGLQFCCFFVIYVIIQYQICPDHIYVISIWILIHENLGLDTKILQLEQKLWHIHWNKVWNWQPSWIFSCFCPFTHIIMVCHVV